MCDGETPKVFDCRIVKANKNHECCECHKEIMRGEEYEYLRGLWEDQWLSFKTCLDCAELRYQYRDDFCSPALGYLSESLNF